MILVIRELKEGTPGRRWFLPDQYRNFRAAGLTDKPQQQNQKVDVSLVSQ